MNTMNTTRLSICTSLLIAGVLLSAGALPVQAADTVYGERTQQLSLMDLNLATIEGQQAARARLQQMAKNLCAQVEDELDLSRHANYLKCVDTATARALPHLDAMIRSETGVRTAAVKPVQQ